MGQAQSGPGISWEKPQKEKRKKKKRGKSLGGFLCLFSVLSCVGRPLRKSSSSNDDTDSESSLSVDGCVTHHLVKGHRDKINTKKSNKHKPKTLKHVFRWWRKSPEKTPPTVMEEEEELLLPLSGPLVLYVPVWHPAPSSRPVLQLTHAGKLLLSGLASLDTLTFFMAPVWLKDSLKAYLTLVGKMILEDRTLLRGQVMEEEEELLLPLSGPLVLYMPVWRPAPSSTPVLQLTYAGKLLLGDFTSLDTLTFFMPHVWLMHPKVYLTPAGEMAFEDPALSRGQPFLLPKHEGEKEASMSEEEPEWFSKEGVFEKDLPLVDLWNASDFHCTRRSAGRLQTLEEVCQLIQIVMNNRTQLWWRKHLHIDLLNPEGSVAVSTIELEVTGVQLLGGRQTSHVMSHHINTRKEFLYFEDGQEVDVMTTFEGFVEAGGETQTTNWSCSNTESTFTDPPPRSPHASPPSPPFEEDFEEDVEEPKVQVPLMQSYFAYKGINDFEGKLAALREAFEDLTNTNQSLNFITHAGRMVLGGLAELNDQDVREFQQAYDRLVSFVNEPGNRQAIEEEIDKAGITQINFLDLFFELVLLGLVEGKTVHAAPRPNGFLQLLFGVILSIQPPEQSWSQSAENFLLRIKSQMQSWMDAIFDFEDHLYGCSQNLSGEVLGNLEIQVEFLLSSLD